LALHSSQDAGIAHLPADQEHRDELRAAAEGCIYELAELQAGVDFTAGCDRGTRRGLVHGSILRAVLPAVGLESEPAYRVHHRCLGHAVRNALLYFVRRPFRQNWTKKDHYGRVPSGRTDLLPDLSRDGSRRRQSRGYVQVHTERCDQGVDLNATYDRSQRP